MRIQRSRTFDDETVRILADVAQRARAVDGTQPFSDDLWRAASAARTDVALTLPGGRTSDRLLGAAFAARQGDREAAEILVDPAHRNGGYGGALLAELLESVPGELWLWSHGDHPAARALAQRHDLERARELLQLRRPSDAPIPHTQPPPGITIRTFVPGKDEPAWVAANAAAFATHPEQGGRTLEDIRAAEEEPWFDPAGFFLAVDPDGEVMGFHWTKIHPTTPGVADDEAHDVDGNNGPAHRLGEVYVLGVHPRSHGLGIGAHLTAVGLAYLARQPDIDEILLYVEGDNAAALTVYERLGFNRYNADVAYRRRR